MSLISLIHCVNACKRKKCTIIIDDIDMLNISTTLLMYLKRSIEH